MGDSTSHSSRLMGCSSRLAMGKDNMLSLTGADQGLERGLPDLITRDPVVSWRGIRKWLVYRTRPEKDGGMLRSSRDSVGE